MLSKPGIWFKNIKMIWKQQQKIISPKCSNLRFRYPLLATSISVSFYNNAQQISHSAISKHFGCFVIQIALDIPKTLTAECASILTPSILHEWKWWTDNYAYILWIIAFPHSSWHKLCIISRILLHRLIDDMRLCADYIQLLLG
jgi:hypothetical protein